jgi:uncharacterized protein (DUF433 family)
MPNKSENPKRKLPKDTRLSPKAGERTGKSSDLHVVPRNDGWAVQGDLVQSKTQREAIERAREIAAKNGSEIIVHGKDGQIRDRNALHTSTQGVGHDQYPPVSRYNRSKQSSSNLSLSKYVEKRYYGERPHIRGRRLLVSMIAANEQANHWNNRQLADEFGLSEEEVLAALLYYREHKSEIDRQDAEAQQEFDEIYRLHGEQPNS